MKHSRIILDLIKPGDKWGIIDEIYNNQFAWDEKEILEDITKIIEIPIQSVRCIRKKLCSIDCGVFFNLRYFIEVNEKLSAVDIDKVKAKEYLTEIKESEYFTANG